MQLTVDTGQPANRTASSIEPAHSWILGLVSVDDGQPSPPPGRAYSFLGECECPDDCLRDHENE